jgi:DNA polymerase-1
MPSALEEQLDPIVAYLRSAGVLSLCRDGVEADDLIASITRRFATPKLPVVIASADKDFMQLVSDHVGLANPGDPERKIWNAEDVRVRTGVSPGQIVDYLSLVGDSVDNIAGLSGVGPKTAARLLQAHGSVNAMLKHPESVMPDRIRDALVAGATVLQRNHEMIRLHDEIEAGIEVEETRLGKPDVGALRQLFAGWGFRSMAAALGPENQVQHELF